MMPAVRATPPGRPHDHPGWSDGFISHRCRLRAAPFFVGPRCRRSLSMETSLIRSSAHPLITDLLTQGVPFDDVQYLAGHASPRTTRLYDRRQKKVTRNIVERISICVE